MTEAPNIVPGQPMTEEQREQLRKYNAEVSVEAERQASEHIKRDHAEGRGTPPVHAVADMLKRKLENDEFEKKQP